MNFTVTFERDVVCREFGAVYVRAQDSEDAREVARILVSEGEFDDILDSECLNDVTDVAILTVERTD